MLPCQKLHLESKLHVQLSTLPFQHSRPRSHFHKETGKYLYFKNLWIRNQKVIRRIFKQKEASKHHHFRHDRILCSPWQTGPSLLPAGCWFKKHRRILAMQSTASMLSGINYLIRGFLLKVNNDILKNKIIMEAVLREDCYRAYMRFLEKVIRKSKRNSRQASLAVWRILPSSRMTTWIAMQKWLFLAILHIFWTGKRNRN